MSWVQAQPRSTKSPNAKIWNHFEKVLKENNEPPKLPWHSTQIGRIIPYIFLLLWILLILFIFGFIKWP